MTNYRSEAKCRKAEMLKPPSRHRIEQRKQCQTSKKAAEMRFPGNRRALPRQRRADQAEEDIQTEPNDHETGDLPFAKERHNGMAGTR